MFVAGMKASGKHSLKLTWPKVSGAKGYDVYFARCNSGGKTYKLKKVKTLGANAGGWKLSGLEKRVSYKALVKVWKRVKGKKVILATSPVVHAYTYGCSRRHTNAKAVKLKSAKKVTLKTSGKSRIRASVVKLHPSLKLNDHTAVLRYYTSDKRVATVNAGGVIRARRKGRCTVTIITSNGMSATVEVRVK